MNALSIGDLDLRPRPRTTAVESIALIGNTYASRYRTAARRPATVPLAGDEAHSSPEPRFHAREIMQAIASAPARYRDAVIAVDVLGLSYKEAASALRTREATITIRLHRGRQHVARVLIDTN